MAITLDESVHTGAKIKIVGVGGAGGNALDEMIDKNLDGVDFIAVNTDMQVLQRNKAPIKIQVGKTLTRGLGAGADPTVGQRAVEENRDEISRVLNGSDMVFVTAGMGGGTGTGGAPIVANIAKSMGALVVGIVTKPFATEGKKRGAYADSGIEEMRKQVDTLIVIPNQKILSVIDRNTSVLEAFAICDRVLYNAARGISELITVPGLINVDFADVRKIMREMGDALMGTGYGKGESRAVDAAMQAISHPLLEGVSIAGAQGALINITGGKNLSLMEVNEAMDAINQAAGEEVEIIFGCVIDENYNDEVTVTVIATGFNKKAVKAQQPPQPQRKLMDRVSTGPFDATRRDTPAYLRRGIEISPRPLQNPAQQASQQPENQEEEKPAFLRKIMD